MKKATLHATLLDLDPAWSERPAVKMQKGSVTYGQFRDLAVRLARLLAERVGKRLLASFVVTSGGSLTRGPDDGPFWSIPFHRLFG